MLAHDLNKFVFLAGFSCLFASIGWANSAPVISNQTGSSVTFEVRENSERFFFNGWDKTFGGSDAENIRSVIKTRDGGFLFLSIARAGSLGIQGGGCRRAQP